MIRIGQTIKEDIYSKDGRKIKTKKWKVQKIYPHIVLCKNAKGFHRCFTYGDLVMMDIIKQSPEIEAMREYRDSLYTMQSTKSMSIKKNKIPHSRDKKT